MTVQRSNGSRSSAVAHRPLTTTETEIARAARELAHDLSRRADRGAKRIETWWSKQLPRTRVGLSIVAVLVAAIFVNVFWSATFGRTAATQPAIVTLTSESAPADAGKAWAVVKLWQGTGNKDTETFTVVDHWRVDWLFNQSMPTGQMQVYIYSADGKLLNVAGNTARGGSDTTFWMGPGTYQLKVNATGGDWKLDVQDLH